MIYMTFLTTPALTCPVSHYATAPNSDVAKLITHMQLLFIPVLTSLGILRKGPKLSFLMYPDSEVAQTVKLL